MLREMVRWIGSTRFGTALARRPRLTMTLLLLVMLVAMQGGAAAADSTDTLYGGDVSTQDGTTTDRGP